MEIVYRELEVKFPAKLRKCIKKYVFPLYFCSFALKCNLGIFIEGEKYGFFVKVEQNRPEKEHSL